MFQIKSIISACLAVAVLLTASVTLAADSDTATPKATAKKSASKAESATSSKSSVKQASAPSSTPTFNESADEINLRAGPGDPVAGEEKAELCKGCHGQNGVSMDPLIPKLAGQYGKYIAKQVRNYQASIRTHQIMGAIAASVTDEDLADITAYFGVQPMMHGDTPSSNQVGKNLFENGDLSRMLVPCNNCHGATGKGQNPRNSLFPVIGGQHKDYLLGQLTNFKKGTRNNSPGGVMNIMVQRLTDAELEAIADYVSGL